MGDEGELSVERAVIIYENRSKSLKPLRGAAYLLSRKNLGRCPRTMPMISSAFSSLRWGRSTSLES